MPTDLMQHIAVRQDSTFRPPLEHTKAVRIIKKFHLKMKDVKKIPTTQKRLKHFELAHLDPIDKYDMACLSQINIHAFLHRCDE
jgi:hypothetical protein